MGKLLESHEHLTELEQKWEILAEKVRVLVQRVSRLSSR
jgi:hypothetical protein